MYVCRVYSFGRRSSSVLLCLVGKVRLALAIRRIWSAVSATPGTGVGRVAGGPDLITSAYRLWMYLLRHETPETPEVHAHTNIHTYIQTSSDLTYPALQCAAGSVSVCEHDSGSHPDRGAALLSAAARAGRGAAGLRGRIPRNHTHLPHTYIHTYMQHTSRHTSIHSCIYVCVYEYHSIGRVPRSNGLRDRRLRGTLLTYKHTYIHTYKSSLRPVSISVFIFHLFFVSHPVLPRNGTGWDCVVYCNIVMASA